MSTWSLGIIQIYDVISVSIYTPPVGNVVKHKNTSKIWNEHTFYQLLQFYVNTPKKKIGCCNNLKVKYGIAFLYDCSF